MEKQNKKKITVTLVFVMLLIGAMATAMLEKPRQFKSIHVVDTKSDGKPDNSIKVRTASNSLMYPSGRNMAGRATGSQMTNIKRRRLAAATTQTSPLGVISGYRQLQDIIADKGNVNVCQVFVDQIVEMFISRDTIATSGDVEAWGNISETYVEAYLEAIAAGDSSTLRSSTISASAKNMIRVEVQNRGDAEARSGQAEAKEVLARRLANNGANITVVRRYLAEGSAANIFFETVYDIATTFDSGAQATSGDVSACGNNSETWISSRAKATSPGSVDTGDGEQNNSNPSSSAQNTIGVEVENSGSANANSGDALAVGIVARNLVNNNINLNVIMQSLEQNSTANVYVNVIYKIAVNLVGNAQAASGDVNASGNSSETSIDSNAEASSNSARQNEVESQSDNSNPSDSAQNTIGVEVENSGSANANSGDALAVGIVARNLVNNNINLNVILQSLGQNSMANVYVNVIYRIAVNLVGNAQAASGDVNASGNHSQTSIDSNTEASSSSGSGSNSPGFAQNTIDVEVKNSGNTDAGSGRAFAVGLLVHDLINTTLDLDIIVNSLRRDTVRDIYVNLIYNLTITLSGDACAISGDVCARANSSETYREPTAETSSSGDGTNSSSPADEEKGETKVQNQHNVTAESGKAVAVGLEAKHLYDDYEHLVIREDTTIEKTENIQAGNTASEKTEDVSMLCDTPVDSQAAGNQQDSKNCADESISSPDSEACNTISNSEQNATHEIVSCSGVSD